MECGNWRRGQLKLLSSSLHLIFSGNRSFPSATMTAYLTTHANESQPTSSSHTIRASRYPLRFPRVRGKYADRRGPGGEHVFQTERPIGCSLSSHLRQQRDTADCAGRVVANSNR